MATVRLGAVVIEVILIILFFAIVILTNKFNRQIWDLSQRMDRLLDGLSQIQGQLRQFDTDLDGKPGLRLKVGKPEEEPVTASQVDGLQARTTDASDLAGENIGHVGEDSTEAGTIQDADEGIEKSTENGNEQDQHADKETEPELEVADPQQTTIENGIGDESANQDGEEKQRVQQIANDNGRGDDGSGEKPDETATAANQSHEVEGKTQRDGTIGPDTEGEELPPVAARAASATGPLDFVTQAAPSVVKPNWEKLIGTRWSVIIGGIAIALGAVLLVTTAAEAGFFGPKIRIFMALLMSAGLFFAGERTRRRDLKNGFPTFDRADIPSILTATGAITGFITIYASYALYDFIGSGLTLILLAIIGLATLLLSSIHGPKMAAVGVLGSYIAPLLVSGAVDALPITLYILVVTATILGMARIREWFALAIAGAAGSLFLLWMLNKVTIFGGYPALAILFIGLAVLYSLYWCAISKSQFNKFKIESPETMFVLASTALMASFVLAQASSAYQFTWATGIAATLAVVFMLAATYRPALGMVTIPVAVMLVCIVALFKLHLLMGRLQPLQGELSLKENSFPIVLSTGLVLLPASGIAIFALMKNAANAPRYCGWLATSITFSLFGSMLVLWLGKSPFETEVPFQVSGLVLALCFAALCVVSDRWGNKKIKAPAPSIFAVGVVAFASFALAISLPSQQLPLAFALTATGIAAIYYKRPLTSLPILALIAAVISSLSLIFNSLATVLGPFELLRSLKFSEIELSTTPFLNQLIWLLGLPALALVAAGELIGRRVKPEQTRSRVLGNLVIALGLANGAMFVSLEIQHYMNDGKIIATIGLSSFAAQTLAALCFTIGLQGIDRSGVSAIYQKASALLGLAGIAMASIGLLFYFNPFFFHENTGTGMFFNTLLLAYGLTGIAAGGVAAASRDRRPRWYTLSYAALGGILFLIYLSANNRHVFQGAYITLNGDMSDLEFWLYSPIWLAYGIIALLIGFMVDSKPVRLGGGLLIGLTILKVFLFDLSALEGIMRAMSFIGLGLVLIAIGRSYQRLLGLGDSPPDSFANKNVGGT